MHVFRTISEFRSWRSSLTGSLGLVPTMGYLHEGHLSLVRAARRQNAHCAVTIFVNPAQFGPDEDLARYPRDEPRDLGLLETAHVDAVFAPSIDEIYPAGFSTYVTVERLTARLEGASRPTHFRGVTTVVAKLLSIAQPERAYFGQKDAQQLIVLRRMARDLDLAVEVIGVPILRESDGLALSSRNLYLSVAERGAALVLHRSLCEAEHLYASGERDADSIRRAIREMVGREALADLDYVSVADAETLEELGQLDGPALASLAVRFGSTRLIDNTVLGSERMGSYEPPCGGW